MNISVIYATVTGHSKKIAAGVAKAFGTEAVNVKSTPVLRGVDLLFIVGGIYGGKGSQPLAAFAEKLDAAEVRNVCLVTTSADPNFKQDDLRELLSAKGITVLGEIHCRGSFLYFFARSHPNESDIEQVTEKAKTIAAAI